MKFRLHSRFAPTGDQPQAIDRLTAGLQHGQANQTLLGVTGSGKTFTMANVIERVQMPTLVIAHNKTLAAQLYQEFRDFFPNNAVSYFVSYYDYYQPEAYIPTTDTYIEKEATINDEIDKLRLSATTNLLTRPDTIVVASVSCIYNLGSPVEYGRYILRLVEGEIISRETLLLQLANLQYDRSDTEFRRGTYWLRGDTIQLWPAYEDKAIRIDTLDNTIESIKWIDPITGSTTLPPRSDLSPMPEDGQGASQVGREFFIYPAKHYIMDQKSQQQGLAEIRRDLEIRLKELRAQNKIVEAYRLEQKVNYDLEMMQEFGYVNGIENYSRYFEDRRPGDPPFTLLDYFNANAKEFSGGRFLTIVDESHITLPQIKGMHHGDRSRKETLIEYGFRLPSALDNRPLKFEEFMDRTQSRVYVSATPETLELSLSGGEVVEQLIRPTGLVDPNIELRPIDGQIEDLVIEIIARKQLGQRVLVTTLTKKMSEALTAYLNDTEKIDKLVASYKEKEAAGRAAAEVTGGEDVTIWSEPHLPVEKMGTGRIPKQYYHHLQKSSAASLEPGQLDYPKVAYLHSDIETLERSDILDDLRRGEYDVVVGINLLREGLDLPEVSLVAILDADKSGFLRSRTSLIQTMGRAARHVEGHAILYADYMTQGMLEAIEETLRRRTAQIAYNRQHDITPRGISKPIRKRMIEKKADADERGTDKRGNRGKKSPNSIIVQLTKNEQIDLAKIDPSALTPYDRKKLAERLRRRMNQAAKDMDFELAAILRDTIRNLG
jgi:excinuclease ABC subunit B